MAQPSNRDAVLEEELYSGWLEKRGAMVHWGWERRWCILWPSALEYFTDETKAESKGRIPIGPDTAARPFRDDSAPGHSIKHRAHKPYGFAVDPSPQGGKERHLFYFDALSSEFLEEWLHAIEGLALRKASELLPKAATMKPREKRGMKKTPDSIRFVDIKGLQIAIEMKAGKMSFSLGGKIKVADVKQLYIEGQSIHMLGKPAMSSSPSAIVPKGKKDLLLDAMDLFSTRGCIEKKRTAIQVFIKSCRGLRNTDGLPGQGVSDPYCSCEVVGKPDTKFKTKYIMNTLSPDWDHVAEIADFVPGETLFFQVWDKDWLSRDDSLGTCTLTLEENCPIEFDGELELNAAGEGYTPCLSVSVRLAKPFERYKADLCQRLEEALELDTVIPCTALRPQVGDVVVLQNTSRKTKNLWECNEENKVTEEVTVQEVDEQGDFKLRGASGDTSPFMVRKDFIYKNLCQADVLDALIAEAKEAEMPPSEYKAAEEALVVAQERRDVRRKLEAAMKHCDPEALASAIEAAKRLGLKASEYRKAEELLNGSMETARKLVEEALASESIEGLEAALMAAKAAKLKPSEYRELQARLLKMKRKVAIQTLVRIVDTRARAAYKSVLFQMNMEAVLREQKKQTARKMLADAMEQESVMLLEEAIQAAKDAELSPKEYRDAAALLRRLVADEMLREAVKEGRAALNSSDLELLMHVRDRLQIAMAQARELGWPEAELMEAEVLRKMINTSVVDAKGMIRVFIRVRPLSKKETDDSEAMVTSQIGLSQLQVVQKKEDVSGLKQKEVKSNFWFDAVFTPGSQDEVFKDCQELACCVLQGFNVTIFAYGQTGSGKTYTMLGAPGDEGVIPRSINDIYAMMSTEEEYTVFGSIIELYLSQAVDLLNVRLEPPKQTFKGATDGVKDSKSVVPLNVRYETKQNRFVIDDLTEEVCKTAADMHELFERGAKNRKTAQTAMNSHSSRSHLLLFIRVEIRNKTTKAKSEGKLCLVDLAGSERIKKSQATGIRQEEAIEINKSLSSLADVIEALTSKAKKVPYRNHVLTEILRDSLGGTAKTLMFVNCSPAESNVDETLMSLRYGQRARGVVNKAKPD